MNRKAKQNTYGFKPLFIKWVDGISSVETSFMFLPQEGEVVILCLKRQGNIPIAMNGQKFDFEGKALFAEPCPLPTDREVEIQADKMYKHYISICQGLIYDLGTEDVTYKRVKELCFKYKLCPKNCKFKIKQDF